MADKGAAEHARRLVLGGGAAEHIGHIHVHMLTACDLIMPDRQTDRLQTDRVQTDRVQTHTIQTDRVQTDRVQTDRVQTDRVQRHRVQTDSGKSPERLLEQTRPSRVREQTRP